LAITGKEGRNSTKISLKSLFINAAGGFIAGIGLFEVLNDFPIAKNIIMWQMGQFLRSPLFNQIISPLCEFISNK